MARGRWLTSLAATFLLVCATAGSGAADKAASPTIPVATGGPALTVNGTAKGAFRVDVAALAAMPQVEIDVAFLTSKGEHRGTYRGVPLWALLNDAGSFDGATARHPSLGTWFEVAGRDGYRVVFSAGEIDPELGGRRMILATARDGKPLPADEGIRLVVPGDGRGARSVRDVVSIAVH